MSLTLSGQTTVQMAEKLKALNGIASMEIAPRGAETTFTLFPVSAHESDVLLIDAVARLARDENWPVACALRRPGRLDEVFRSLTSFGHRRDRWREDAA